MAVAKIYYKDRDYNSAAAYYDSAYVLIDEDFADYKQIQARAGNLNSLVSYLNSVTLQDSLQYLASLDEPERNKIIDDIIADVVAEEQAKKQQEIEMMLNQQFAAAGATSSTGNSESGKWYFYNPSAKGQGAMEFKRIWGDRKLEDNWRRKNKRMIVPQSAANEESEIVWSYAAIEIEQLRAVVTFGVLRHGAYRLRLCVCRS